MAQFEIFPGSKQQFFFRLKKSTGEKVLSSEAYLSKTACLVGITAVKANAALDNQYERIGPPASKHCFVLKGTNGQLIAKSDFYSSDHARENDIDCVKKIAAKATILDLT